jgi:hypothetical protein
VKLFIFLWIPYFYEQSEKIDVETRRWGDREIERLGDWKIGREAESERGRRGDFEHVIYINNSEELDKITCKCL